MRMIAAALCVWACVFGQVGAFAPAGHLVLRRAAAGPRMARQRRAAPPSPLMQEQTSDEDARASRRRKQSIGSMTLSRYPKFLPKAIDVSLSGAGLSASISALCILQVHVRGGGGCGARQRRARATVDLLRSFSLPSSLSVARAHTHDLLFFLWLSLWLALSRLDHSLSRALSHQLVLCLLARARSLSRHARTDAQL